MMNFELLKDLAAPKACVFCDELMDMETIIPVCDECRGIIPFVDGKTCEVCGVPLSENYADIYCGRCRKTKFHFERNVSRYIYENIVSESLKRMKFGVYENWIAEVMGSFLSDTIEKKYEGINFDCILYVPISLARKFERGFNQSEVIADTVSKKLGIKKYDDVLYKIKEIPKQSNITDRKEREKNVKGAYDVYNHQRVEDKTVLLIDDIITTGSTLNECARMLKKSGAAIVYTATVAVTKKG